MDETYIQDFSLSLYSLKKMTKFAGIPILFNRNEIKNKIDEILEKDKKGFVNTINSNIVICANENNDYKKILNNAIFNICDGSVLTSCINIINNTKYVSYPGPDFFIDIISNHKFKHCFVGGAPNVLQGLKTELKKINTTIDSSLFLELPFQTVENFNYLEIAERINKENPDFIWVSLGAPKQEQFSEKLHYSLNRGIIVSVGAAFNFYSGNKHIKRAPKLIRKLKLEWFYRIFQEPSKTAKRLFKELIGMPKLILLEWFNTKR